jgi:hypothetical protein
MITSSSTLVARTMVALGYLSESWPAVAENKKYGAMKMPEDKGTSCSGPRPAKDKAR